MNNEDENRHNLVFKTPDLSPPSYSHSPSPENRRLRIADILADEEHDNDGDCGGYGPLGVVEMSGHEERNRRGRSFGLHCSSPRRIIARCLAALRSPRGRRISAFGREKRDELGQISPHATCLMHVPNSRDSPVSGSESEDSGEVILNLFCSLYYY